MNATQIRPIGDNILVKKLDDERTSMSGIILPQQSRGQQYDQVEIIACGPNSESIPGTHAVIMGKGLYERFDLDGHTYFIIKDADVMLTVS